MIRRLVLALGFVLALAIPASAQGLCPGLQHEVFCYAHETLTVSTVALTFTPSVYQVAGKQGPTYASVTIEGANIRVWFDGSVPTASVGELVLPPGFNVCGGDSIRAFQAIRATADVNMSVTYCR